MNDAKKPFPDPLVRQRLFPDPVEVFAFVPKSLKEALQEGIIAIDTNVLLVPYTTGQASLQQIRNTYDRLTKAGRLRIPGQVAREFADNRAEKLKILFQQLSRKRDANLSRSEYPLLEGIGAYSDMVEREGQISKALSEYRQVIGKLLEIVAGWHWDDPVSQIYRDLFKAPVVVDPEIDRERLLEELKYRQEHRIPPGFKDANNDHSGVGDLLIWKTLLKIGEQESRDLIFVSGDEKNDWRYLSENQALYPRFELLDEYRRASNGKSLLIISFAELLEEFDVPATVVAEVKQEESAASSIVRSTIQLRSTLYRGFRAAQAVRDWLSSKYPTGQIEERMEFPDFLVATDHGIEGYDVKYFSLHATSERITDAAHRAQAFFEATQIPVNIVLVVEDALEDFITPQHVWRALKNRWSSSISTILIGMLTSDGKFQLRHRVSAEER